MTSKRFITAGFGVAVGLTVVVSYGVVVSADHAWGKYHWDGSSTPVHLTLGANFATSAWTISYDDAVFDWDMSGVLSLTKVTGATTPSTCNPANGTIEACADTYGENGWLGLAQIWARGPHIRRALAKMNDTYFNTADYNTPAWRALVMCQEIGHDFGLGHQDENFDNPNLNTCMDYTSDPFRVRRRNVCKLKKAES